MRPILPAHRSGRRPPVHTAPRPRVGGCRCSPPTSARLDHVLATAQRDGRLPSVAAGLVRGGELVWSGAAGTVDGRADGRAGRTPTRSTGWARSPRPSSRCACCGCATPAGSTSPTGSARTCRARPSTTSRVEQLLTHAAGTQAETPGPWWERTPGGDWDALVASPVGQRFRAGRRFHYSNVGYAALGRLLEVHHGRGWFDVVRDELLEPLGMTRTTTRPSGPAALGLAVHPFADVLLPEPEHDAGAMAPAGQLWTTVPDLARWATFLGGDDGRPALGRHARRDGRAAPRGRRPGPAVGRPRTDSASRCGTSAAPGSPVTAGRCPASSPGCGCGWMPVCRLAAQRPGPLGPTARHPARPVGAAGDGVVLFTNTTASTATRSIVDELLDGLARHEPAPVEPWSASGDPALLELVGTWHWGPATVTATVAGEHLVLGEPGTGRGARFRSIGDRRSGSGWTATTRASRCGWCADADGSVSHLDLASFRFTRTPYDPTGRRAGRGRRARLGLTPRPAHSAPSSSTSCRRAAKASGWPA